MKISTCVLMIALITAAIPVHAETLVSWLHESVDEAYVRSPLEDDAFRLALHAIAEEHATGYRLSDLSACRQKALADEISLVTALQIGRGPREQTGLPAELMEMFPERFGDRRPAALPAPESNIDPERLFTRAIILALHAPEFEPVDEPALREQVDRMVQTMVDAVRERNPGVVDDALAETLAASWQAPLIQRVEDCYHPAFKVPLPEEDFEELLHSLREAMPDSLATNSTLSFMLESDTPHANEMAAVFIQSHRNRTGHLITRAYLEQSHEVYPPTVDAELSDRLEAAGLDPHIGHRHIRVLDAPDPAR